MPKKKYISALIGKQLATNMDNDPYMTLLGLVIKHAVSNYLNYKQTMNTRQPKTFKNLARANYESANTFLFRKHCLENFFDSFGIGVNPDHIRRKVIKLESDVNSLLDK